MRTNARNGFTLLEVLIVVVILSIALGIAVSHGPSRSVALESRAVTANLVRTLRTARGLAILRGRPVLVVVDFSRRATSVDGAALEPWPVGVSLSPGRVKAAREVVRFDPDGGGSGGRLDVVDGRIGYTVAIDWLSGRVSVAQTADAAG